MYNPYKELLEQEVSSAIKENKIENNFLGFFKLGCSYSEFQNACNKFEKSKCDEHGSFYIDGIEFKSFFTVDVEKKELTTEKVAEFFDYRHPYGRSFFFLDDKLVYLGVRSSNSINVAYFKNSNGYDVSREDVETLNFFINEVKQSLSKKYGEPAISLTSDGDIPLCSVLQGYVVSTIDSSLGKIGPRLFVWKCGDISVELSCELSNRDYDHVLSTNLLISFFNNKIYEEGYLRKKFNLPVEVEHVEESEW